MTALGTTFKFFLSVTILLCLGALVSAAPRPSPVDQSPIRRQQSQCTFSDGSTIAVGRKAAQDGNTNEGFIPESGDNSWSAGPYQATAFRVTERMIIPPIDGGLVIPAGSYTLFVKAQGDPPWTLIVSKKNGEWGMPYPGEQYDLGRTEMGSDVQPSVDGFKIGCANFKDTGGPIFLWMQSGRQVAYVKILAEQIEDGKVQYLVH